MREPVYNLFLFVDGGLIGEIGAVAHECGGTDGEKIRLLQSKVNDDYRVCRRYPVPDWCIVVTGNERLPRRLSYETFLTLQMLGRHNEFWEHVLADLGAPQDPLLVVTPVVDGRPRIDNVTDLTPEMNPVQWD